MRGPVNNVAGSPVSGALRAQVMEGNRKTQGEESGMCTQCMHGAAGDGKTTGQLVVGCLLVCAPAWVNRQKLEHWFTAVNMNTA